MAVNARTEEFQHIEVFDKPALFTNGRIARDTVPKGWYCYDIRGSDDDPGELCYMEENVVVNHAGSVLMPEKLAMPKSGRLDVRDELGFLDEGDMTLREFCEAHQLPYPAENMKFHIRPARPEEAGLFYAQHPEEDKRLGAVGCVRMDFGRSGNEFWHTWWPRGSEKLNSPAFELELQEVVDTLRESVLKNRFAMERFCYEHGGKISGGWTQNYGYIVETEHYRYCLRCNPSPGDYNCYCTAYDLDVQRQNMARDKPLVGHVSFANGDTQEFTDAEAFLKCVREELPYRPTTGFRYEVLTDDPSVRKHVVYSNSDHLVTNFLLHTDVCSLGLNFMYRPYEQYDIKPLVINGCEPFLQIGYVRTPERPLSPQARWLTDRFGEMLQGYELQL